jgi:hypothetical protein
MMKKYNRKLAQMWRVGNEKIPIFSFNEVDLLNDGKFREEAFKLWQQGNISRKTLLNDYYNMDYDQEKERKQKENETNENEIFVIPTNPFTTGSGTTPPTEGGRPPVSTKDSKQDKNNSNTSKQPKPSSK